MQYKLQYSQSVNQEDTTLDMTSEKLSSRSQKSQVPPKHKQREEINVSKGHLNPSLIDRCYATRLPCIYIKIWLVDIHTKECVYTSLHDK